MFLRLWNYLRGYVIIKVTGFSVERFVNLAVHKGIYIWDVTYIGDGVYMKVSAKGFKLLKSCAHKTKCKIKITGKKGYPFIAHRYRKRKMFVFGLLFFVVSLYIMSSFIWLVEINGNERMPTETISDYFASQGLKVGGYKYAFNKKEVEKLFLNSFHDVSWVNISVKGTKATIQLTETLPRQSIVDRTTPCNVVAQKDGLITSIATSAGMPLKKEGDVILQGELIVSGEVIAVADEGEIRSYVHANAEVRAKTYYEINLQAPFEYEEREYTGETVEHYQIKLFEKIFDLNLFRSSISYASYDKIISRKQIMLSDDYPLPIIFITSQYREFTPINKTRTLSQAMELGEKMVTSRIIHEFDFDADIVDKALTFTEESDGLQVYAIITALERIDRQEPIQIQQTE